MDHVNYADCYLLMTLLQRHSILGRDDGLAFEKDEAFALDVTPDVQP